MNRKPINIHDRTHITAGFISAIRLANFQHRAKGGVGELFDEAKALKAAARRYRRHRGDTSKYTPHQGAQECARRVRQMARGII